MHVQNRQFQGRDDGILETLELVTGQMAVAVSRCSQDFRYLWVNQAYADWIRRPVREIAGRSIKEVLGAGAFDALLPLFRRVLAGEKVEYEHEIHVQGIGSRWVSVRYNPTRAGNGAVDGWVAVVLDTTDRKRMEETRFRHAAIVESSEDAIISKNLNGFITGWNLGAERMFGYREEEVIGHPITILVPPELRDEEQSILQRLRAGGRVEHYETQRITKAGERVHVSLTIGPIRDSLGRAIGFCKIAQDITEQKKAQAAVKESEARFRLVADTAPVLIWMAGPDKLCNYFNKTWLDFTGRSKEQEFGYGWAEGVHPGDLKQCVRTYEESFNRREKFSMEYRLKRHDGEYRWILDIGVPRFNPDASFAGYIGIAVDVTERKRSEEALRELNEALKEQTALLQSKEELLTTFVTKAPAGVAMLDCDMRYIQASDRWCADYSVDRSQLLGRSHYELFPDIPERWRDAHRRALAGETVKAEEDRWDRPDGTQWLRWELHPWHTAGGAIGGLLILAEDITRRKQMEETLFATSRKLVELQELERARIGRELHDDINQRIALLGIGLEQLLEDPSDFQRRIQKLHAETTELAINVQGLARELHVAKLEYLGAEAAIRSWCKEFGARQKIDIAFTSQITGSLPPEIGLCLFRVVQECLHNASKYSGARLIEVRLEERATDVHLSISDSGTGFDMETAQHGRGLGLTTMRERVLLVKGSIAIESKPMGGTRIAVRIPVDSNR